MSSQIERAELLRRLHLAPEILVAVNVWDVASARTAAAVDGVRMLATASWSVAAAHGYADGEEIPLDLMLATIERVASATDLPVSADLEAGYGDVGATIAKAIAAGAVGCNLEDSGGDAGEHVERVRAARAAGDAAGVPIVINARTDVLMAKTGDEAEAIARARAYLDAGADCAFVLGPADAESIARVVEGVGGPVSLMAWPGVPPVAELERLGVARVSFGPGTQGLAMAALARGVEEILHGASLPADLGFRTPAS